MTILDIALAKLTVNADALGEVLRSVAFDPSGHGAYGCYSTFEVNKAFTKVDHESELGKQILRNFARCDDGDDADESSVDDLVFDYPNVVENLYSAGDVYMAWLWDGDGTLFFAIPSTNRVLLNTDCKKDYGWKMMEWR